MTGGAPKEIANLATVAAGPRGRGGLIALAAVSFVLVLGVVEVGLRVTLSPSDQAALPGVGLGDEAEARRRWEQRVHAEGTAGQYGFDEPDPELGWRLRPGVRIRSTKPDSYDVMITTTPAGLRGGTETAPGGATHRPRIALFGCSQTFGEGVEDADTYAARLAKAMPQAEVLNFGVHGYGTDQMLLRYERDGRSYAPDVVVLAFAGFHIARNVTGFTFFAKPHFQTAANGELRLVGVPVPTPEKLATQEPPEKSFADSSVLLRWLWQRVRNIDESRLSRPDGDAWRLTRALIARFARDVKEGGGIFILMNIDEGFPELDGELRALAASLGIRFLDLAPVMRRLGARGITYRLPHDHHWNATAHETVAEELRTYLCRERIAGECGT